MPDRIIKESACISETLNKLTDFEERFWWRLTVNCDDYGRFDARPAVLKSRLFPLAESKTMKDMTKALNSLASVGLVEIYYVDGKPFLHVVTWEKHQRIRAKRSKFPSPDEGCCRLTSVDSECVRNPIQSESNPNPNANACADKPQKSTRKKYGSYENVLLSDEEYEKLQNEFPSDYLDRIERLSEYIASTGKKYSSHLATIRSWARNDGGQNMIRSNKKSVPVGATGDLGSAEREAIARLMGGGV